VWISTRERLDSELRDSESELRQLFARVARSEAKNFFALHYGTEVEKFERELAARAERVLAELGSAAPSLEQYAADAVALTMPDAAAIATGVLAVKAYHDQHTADVLTVTAGCVCNPLPDPVKSSCPATIHKSKAEYQ
jgi:hypothetical protein